MTSNLIVKISVLGYFSTAVYTVKNFWKFFRKQSDSLKYKWVGNISDMCKEAHGMARVGTTLDQDRQDYFQILCCGRDIVVTILKLKCQKQKVHGEFGSTEPVQKFLWGADRALIGKNVAQKIRRGHIWARSGPQFSGPDLGSIGQGVSLLVWRQTYCPIGATFLPIGAPPKFLHGNFRYS